MRWLVFSLIICCIGICYSTGVIAGDDWGGSLGLAYWKPEWDRSGSSTGTTSGIWGPSGALNYRNFSLSVQYFTGKFDIELSGINQTYDANRTDLDLAISYRFLKYFSGTIGYKNISYDWGIKTYALDTTISGFALGLGAAYTFPAGFLLYGAGSYLPALEYEWNYGGIKDSNDATGTTLEAGAGYVIKKWHLITKLGYRYQKFDIDEDISGADFDEKIDGFRFGIDYYF